MKRTWYKSGEALLKEISETVPDNNELAVWYLGQCGFAVKSKDCTLLIDPVLSDLCRPDGTTRRQYPSPFAPEELRADLCLITHGHRDHLAEDTIRGLCKASPELTLIAPGACREVLLSLGVKHFLTADDLRPIPEKGVSVLPFSAAHPTHLQTPEGEETAVGYRIKTAGLSLIHTGDTYLTDRLLNTLMTLSEPDVLFVPVNGADYFRTARNCIGNLNPLEAARLSAMLRAGITIPMHFVMVEGNLADPVPFIRALWEENPSARFSVPALGERLLFRASE